MPDLYGRYSTESTLKGSISSRNAIAGQLSVGTVIDDKTKTYILVDELGNEVPAVLVDEEVALTATANDIRLGSVAVTEEGVTVGEKFIPPYYTTVGYRIVTNGSVCSIPLPNRNAHDYTALQCIICAFNTNLNNSVGAEKVVINDKVYDTKSVIALSDVTKDHDTKTVHLGITNDSGKHCILRYFTYKEEE